MRKVTATIGKNPYKTTITNGTHQVIADEPIPHGKDLGPTPYDLLLNALGACICMTVKMYADRKNWDLEELKVELTQNRVYHEDCIECSSEEGYVHVIDKCITIRGNLNDKQRNRLLEIANKCPVHKTLSKEILIR
ncbi:OsmC family protein [Maribacter litoralis]|uniref:Putative redox protein n=1 Tax=Maribacter litoralis TaxID=2059726 RepID=A0A653XDK8_9FLAO|nr:OsmC family protein [Maribacter litoralis]VXC28147.1 putative redox protein [Maribacter litoralis]